MIQDPLIDAVELARHLGDARWVIVDCRFELTAPEAGATAYREGHIPGARYAHLDRDLSRPPQPTEGRHPLPEPVELAERLGAWGIDNESVVVAYDDGSGAIAARLWWLVGWLGHSGARVLDGGFKAWRAASLPIETAVPTWEPRRFAPQAVDAAAVVATHEVEPLQRQGNLVVDARGAARFRGEQEPIDPVAGHVPGARNWPFSSNLTPDGRFRESRELARELGAFFAPHDPKQIIAMCGSGVTACHLLLAMAVAGFPPGRLYAGSWSEWIRDPARPVRTGND